MSLIEVNEKIAEKLIDTHKVIEKAVVNGYKTTEAIAVTGFNKISDKCIGAFFTKDNETVEEAKARMSSTTACSEHTSLSKVDE